MIFSLDVKIMKEKHLKGLEFIKEDFESVKIDYSMTVTVSNRGQLP